MKRQILAGMCIAMLAACTTMGEVNLQKIERYEGRTVSIAVGDDGYSDVTIERVEDGVIYTQEGQEFAVEDVESVSARKVSASKTASLALGSYTAFGLYVMISLALLL